MTVPANLKGRRRQPDVRNIKKSSDIRKARSKRLIVGGARLPTATGYKVPGFSGKSFETYFECMLEGTTTPLVMHPKKDRTIRIVSGSAFVVTSITNDDGTVTEDQKRVIAGDEVALVRGMTYRIATAGEQVEMFVCQQAKYEAALEVVEEMMAPVAIPADLLQAPTVHERLVKSRPQEARRPRRGSRAKEQMVAARGGRVSPQVQIQQSNAQTSPEYGGTANALNAKPSGGRFDDAGAG